MAIFQLPDLTAGPASGSPRWVCASCGRSDHADMAGTHLHPKDVPGAIVSLDWADPPESWRWAGPAWTRAVAQHLRARGRALRPSTLRPSTLRPSTLRVVSPV